jgi:hypothetical protein
MKCTAVVENVNMPACKPAAPKDHTVMHSIVELLKSYGFKPDYRDREMYKSLTSCRFDFDTLLKYDSVEAFQAEWPYPYKKSS